jgi:hypothetical protein
MIVLIDSGYLFGKNICDVGLFQYSVVMADSLYIWSSRTFKMNINQLHDTPISEGFSFI